MGKLSRPEAVESYYEKAVKTALAHVEELAREAMRKDKRLSEFVMAMGSWHFIEVGGGVVDDQDAGYGTHMKPLVAFMDNWSDVLKLTGHPMRFTATSAITRDW